MRLGNIQICYIKPKQKKIPVYSLYLPLLYSSIDIIRTNTIDGVRTRIIKQSPPQQIDSIKNIICYVAIAYLVYIVLKKKGEMGDDEEAD